MTSVPELKWSYKIGGGVAHTAETVWRKVLMVLKCDFFKPQFGNWPMAGIQHHQDGEGYASLDFAMHHLRRSMARNSDNF